MNLGISIPQLGILADPAAVRAVAVAAERVGYESLWALDRLLAPVAPRSTYPGNATGALPREMSMALDPIGTLTLAAAVTERIRLGTSVLVAPWYPPVVLARSLTTLDVISGGRLTVGLGLGWSIDEYEAAGVSMSDRGRRLDETLDVFDAVWGAGPADLRGRFVSIAPADVLPKPVQRPRPPLLLAASTPAGLDRVARRADGWNPAGLPIEALRPMWAGVRQRAESFGRDPDELRLVVRANVELSATPLGPDRTAYHGTLAQVAVDLAATRDAGAHEAIIALVGDRTVDEVLERCSQLAEAVELDRC